MFYCDHFLTLDLFNVLGPWLFSFHLVYISSMYLCTGFLKWWGHASLVVCDWFSPSWVEVLSSLSCSGSLDRYGLRWCWLHLYVMPLLDTTSYEFGSLWGDLMVAGNHVLVLVLWTITHVPLGRGLVAWSAPLGHFSSGFLDWCLYGHYKS